MTRTIRNLSELAVFSQHRSLEIRSRRARQLIRCFSLPASSESHGCATDGFISRPSKDMSVVSGLFVRLFAITNNTLYLRACFCANVSFHFSGINTQDCNC